MVSEYTVLVLAVRSDVHCGLGAYCRVLLSYELNGGLAPGDVVVPPCSPSFSSAFSPA